MHSITNVVKVGYGPGDTPCPAFSCPVVLADPVLKLIPGGRQYQRQLDCG